MPISSNTEGKRLGLALVVISAAQVMIVLNTTIVNVALSTIRKGLHFPTANPEWLVTAYAPTLGGLLLVGGLTDDLRQAAHVHDRHGPLGERRR